MRAAVLDAAPEAQDMLIHRLPCTALYAWLSHHAWHTAREHVHRETLNTDEIAETEREWEAVQQDTAQVYAVVVEEFWQARAECTCLAHRVARDYRMVYAVLTGEPLQDEPATEA